jgi:hypothetical protein
LTDGALQRRPIRPPDPINFSVYRITMISFFVIGRITGWSRRRHNLAFLDAHKVAP